MKARERRRLRVKVRYSHFQCPSCGSKDGYELPYTLETQCVCISCASLVDIKKVVAR